MAAFAPTKTFTRAVSANLEYQRQLGLAQNSLETKKRHARCDLNTQIITLRETLFNIRARTPTIVSDEQDNGSSSYGSTTGSPRRGSLLNGTSRQRRSSSSASGKNSKGLVPASTPVGGGAFQTGPTGETLVSSQNGLVATGPKAFTSSRARAATPRRVLHVSVGMSDSKERKLSGESGTPRNNKQRIDVRLGPPGRKPGVGTPMSDQQEDPDGTIRRAGPVKADVRRVVFSAHIRKKKPLHNTPGLPAGKETPLQDESDLGSTCSSIRPVPRPATAGDDSLETAGLSHGNTTSNSLVSQLPRTSSRTSTIITTPSGVYNEPAKATGKLAIIAGNHPSTKANQQEEKLKAENKRKLTNLRPSTVSPGKPNSFFLVRNPFFKLDPSTEKRIDQVETIRLSLHDIYQKRLDVMNTDDDDKASSVDPKSENCKGKTKSDVTRIHLPKSSTSRNETKTPKNTADANLSVPSRSDSRSTSPNPETSVSKPKGAVTVKVKMSSTPKRFSRYSVHHQTGPLTIPGVSNNQLRDLERFHLLMNRRTSIAPNTISS